MRIAVVGSGAAGLGATWLLNEHSAHDVTLFEKHETRTGGHVNTAEFVSPRSGDKVAVDTGFIVFNAVTYPNFLRFAKQAKGVDVIDSDMSFSVSRDQGAFEWAGSSAGALFAQRSNLLNPLHWRMVWDILRFNACALELLSGDADDAGGEEPIESYLARNGYSHAFRDNYILPMTAAIWSTPIGTAALSFPILTLVRFAHNHHLLQIFGRPRWLTLRGGARTYVEAITSQLPKGTHRLGASVSAVSSKPAGGVRLRVSTTDKVADEDFDHVVLACHADEALAMLRAGGGATKDEEDALSRFRFSDNTAVLHSDVSLMPKRREAWTAWNYLMTTGARQAVSLTYWMNLLQSLDESKHGPVLVTLNPPFSPRPALTHGTYDYTHPLFDARTADAQARYLNSRVSPTSIQSKRGISFAGAWTKYGFHEDGFSSGLRAAALDCGARPPFDIRAAERKTPDAWTDLTLRVAFQGAERARRVVSALVYAPFALVVVLACAILSRLLSLGAAVDVGEGKKSSLVRAKQNVEMVQQWYSQ